MYKTRIRPKIFENKSLPSPLALSEIAKQFCIEWVRACGLFLKTRPFDTFFFDFVPKSRKTLRASGFLNRFVFFALSTVIVPQHAELTPWLELKPSYFFCTACPLKAIYDKGGFEIQVSGSVPVGTYLDFYGSVGYRRASGHALNTGEKTTLTVVPFDIGLKPVVKVCEHLYYFFAVGPRVFYFQQHNTSPYVDCKLSGGGIGLFINTGFNALIKEHFLLGVFGEYSYETKTICPKKPNVYSNGSIQLGGLAFGISLGYAF